MSSNGSTTCYSPTHFSLIGKWKIWGLLALTLPIFIACSVIVFLHWSEVPVGGKVALIACDAIVLLAIIIVPLNGFYVTKNGTVIFIPDFRIIVAKIWACKITITFIQRKTDKYSAKIKIAYGKKTINVDYDKQYCRLRRGPSKNAYVLSEKKMRSIAETLGDFAFVEVIIFDNNTTI